MTHTSQPPRFIQLVYGQYRRHFKLLQGHKRVTNTLTLLLEHTGWTSGRATCTILGQFSPLTFAHKINLIRKQSKPDIRTSNPTHHSIMVLNYISPSDSVKNSTSIKASAPHQATFHHSEKPSTYEVLPKTMAKKKKVKVIDGPTKPTTKKFSQSRFDKAFKVATVSSKPSKAYNPLPFAM